MRFDVPKIQREARETISEAQKQSGTAKGIRGEPNQLPEVYLERLIHAYTNPGDLVLDPFVGSGTTVVVAEALWRWSIGIDVSRANVDSSFERLQKGAVRVER